jgi:prepilin-type N-terminal cleavage/methylation domain-containing protein
MMKRTAFSLIELIFVIVLMGVLTGIGFYMSQPDPTRADAQYTLLKLKEARYRAIGYDALDSAGCVTLNEGNLSSDETPKHTLKSTIVPLDKTICFDALGRPHEGNSTALDTLMGTDLNITFHNGDKNTTILLYSGTGYAIIGCKN